MDAVLYYTNPHKKINGTLFYCFEYFIYLKQYLPNIKYFLMNTDENDLELFKSVFREKYIFNESSLDDIIPLKRYTDFMRYYVDNLLILDVNSYNKMRLFTAGVRSVRVYSNDTHSYLGVRPNHKFYGWYDYQVFDVKERIKLYSDIHRTYKVRGNKTFISSLHPNNDVVLLRLGLDKECVLTKKLSEHNENLFEKIDHIIYWHIGKVDKNNRIVVESYIHNIPITIHYNGNKNDSVKERYDVLNGGNPSDLFLSTDDKLTKDFLNDSADT